MKPPSCLFWLWEALRWGSTSAELDDHGFRKDPALERWLRESGIAECNIPRLAGAAINVGALRSSMEQFQPVVVSWQLRASWTVEDLVESYFYASVNVRAAAGRSSVGEVNFMTTLDHYLNLTRHATLPNDLTASENRGMVFARWDQVQMELNATRSACSLTNVVLGRSACSAFLSLGLSRSGLPFHRHLAFSYTVEQGRKLFVLMPPGSIENQEQEVRMDLTVLPPAVAVRRHSKLLTSGDVLRCILEPGESLFVPPYWNHMTLGLGDSFGVSDQFLYINDSKETFWTDWCASLVPELVRCESQVECVDRHFHVFTQEEVTAATLEAPMHQCVAPALALYWQPRDSHHAAFLLRSSADWYVKMFSVGLEALVAAEIISTWALIAEHFLKTADLAQTLAQTADSFFVRGGYWRVARQQGNLMKQRHLYNKLQLQLQFTDPPACELRLRLMENGLLPKRHKRTDL